MTESDSSGSTSSSDSTPSDSSNSTPDGTANSGPDSTAELRPEFGTHHDYDATASASLSETPVAPEPGAIGTPGTGPGWNTYSGLGNGPGWSGTPTYHPTEGSGPQGPRDSTFETEREAYGGRNYTTPGQQAYEQPSETPPPTSEPTYTQYGQPPTYGPVYGQQAYDQPNYGQQQFGGPVYGQQQYPPTYPQQGYGGYPNGPSGYSPVDPSAPYGRDPISGEPLSDKSKTTAGLLQILVGFLGICGIGRLYLGSTGIGLAQLLLVLFGFVLMIVLIGFIIVPVVWIWAFVDGVMMLTGSVRDPQGRKLRD